MNTMMVVRIAKLVALLGFVLPWAAVSCQGQDFATASGIEMAQGVMTAVNREATGPAAPDMPQSLGLNFFVIAAAAVIVIGLALTFVVAGKNAARNAVITSLLAVALSFGGMWWFKDSITREIQKSENGKSQAANDPFSTGGQSPFGGGQSPFGGDANAMAQSMINSMIQERFGYWITLGGLIVAAGAGALAMAGGAAALVKPPEQPS